jgi:UDP-N-acetylglucosamine--N-acetylmuramyl-(pentapeptide) pyrophosphoryl-undecaprenol N-acetylglucosamine transferase
MGLATGDLLWIGTRGEVEETLVPRADLRLETISGGAIVGVPWRVRLANAARLIGSLGRVNGLFREFRPHALFMTGGYVNVPVALVAWLRRVPAMIYLPDIEPGTAIKTLSQLARRVACTAAASEQYFPAGKVVVTGYPVRPELRAAGQLSQADALARFDLTSERPTLFVFGGSRGARSINRALMAALPELLSQIQVIHVSGTLDWPEVAGYTADLPAELRSYYRPFAYLHEEMGPAFRAADLVLARAGASMLGECPAFGLPSILVPYPYAWRYQKVNADYLVERGSAVRLDDERLAEILAPTVLELIKDRQRLSEMRAAAERLDVPDAARNLARAIRELAERAMT